MAGLSSAQVASKVSSILQGQIIVDAVIVVVLSAEDVYDLMNGRISSEQLLSNLTVTVTTVASGTAGYYVGGAIGSAIAPGVGTAVGAVAGSMVMGFAGGYIADKVVDKMYKSDAEEMFEIIKSEFEKLSVDYLITEEEGNAICDELSKSLTEDVTKDMYASDNREEYAASLMRPLFEEQITNRTSINIPTMEQVREEMLNDLEGIVFIH